VHFAKVCSSETLKKGILIMLPIQPLKAILPPCNRHPQLDSGSHGELAFTCHPGLDPGSYTGSQRDAESSSA